MSENSNFSAFPHHYHPLTLKTSKPSKVFFLYLSLVVPYAISSLWDNLEPSYDLKRVFDACRPGAWGRAGISEKPVLVGVRASKTNLYTKIRDPIFYRIDRVILSRWLNALFYISRYMWNLQHCTWNLTQMNLTQYAVKLKHPAWKIK